MTTITASASVSNGLIFDNPNHSLSVLNDGWIRVELKNVATLDIPPGHVLHEQAAALTPDTIGRFLFANFVGLFYV